MRVIDLSSLTWRKSSYSNSDGGQCLEVAAGHPSLVSLVPVRDSKAPERGALVFGARAWSAFVGGVTRTARGR